MAYPALVLFGLIEWSEIGVLFFNRLAANFTNFDQRIREKTNAGIYEAGDHFDFYKMIPFREDEYHIAALDFPGSGFSDKPLDGYSYMLAENAQIVDYFVREVVGFDDFALFTAAGERDALVGKPLAQLDTSGLSVGADRLCQSSAHPQLCVVNLPGRA